MEGKKIKRQEYDRKKIKNNIKKIKSTNKRKLQQTFYKKRAIILQNQTSNGFCTNKMKQQK